MSHLDDHVSEPWADVHLAPGDHPAIGYRSGLTVYEEALIRGQFVGRAWNGAGFLSPWEDARLDPALHAMPQSFSLEIDGQLLGSHWAWGGLERLEVETGIEAIVTLTHTLRPVTVRVYTRLDGTPVMTRWLEITNDGDRPAALSMAAPWSGVLQVVKNWASHLPDPTAPLFSVGYMADDRWVGEGRFVWQPLPSTGLRIDGQYRRDKHRHPMFIVRNHATGVHFFGQLAWSGGYSFEFDLDAEDADRGASDGSARLWFRAGPDAPAPQRIIAPGETVRSPELHLGMLIGDLDQCVQAMHAHLRRSVFRPNARERAGLIESAIGPEVEITVEATLRHIEVATALGAELFWVDASWYTPPGGEWWSTVGDWQVDRDRFPDGLGPIRDLVRSRGMLFGLWMEAERIGSRSAIRAEHPEWLATAYDGRPRVGDSRAPFTFDFSGMLDLSNPEVAAWLEDRIGRVIADNELDFFRLDWNGGQLRAGGQVERDGYIESIYWRYNEALYAMFDRLRARFPEVLFENCASGGGRTDIGMLQRFGHTWVSDWGAAPRLFRIANGMTMALPPESIMLMYGLGSGHTLADVDFQARLMLFGHAAVVPFSQPGSTPNPVQLERVRHTLDLHKTFVRPFAGESLVFHHTPILDGLDPKGWGVLELASAGRDRALVGLFRLASPDGMAYVLRPRGLDRSRRYRVTWDNRGEAHEVDGATLIGQGLVVQLEAALTSELILFEAL